METLPVSIMDGLDSINYLLSLIASWWTSPDSCGYITSVVTHIYHAVWIAVNYSLM